MSQRRIVSQPTIIFDCQLHLEGERIGTPGGGLPAPVPCVTGVLNRQGTVEFADGQSSRRDGEKREEVDKEELAMMGGVLRGSPQCHGPWWKAILARGRHLGS